MLEQVVDRTCQWGSVADVIQAIASISSLLIVLYIYKISRNDRRVDKVGAADSFWVREFIIAPNRDVISKSFSDISELVESFAEIVRSSDGDSPSRGHSRKNGGPR